MITVNGERIPASAVAREQRRLDVANAQGQRPIAATASEEEACNRVIERVLMRQAAAASGIEISADDVMAEVNRLKKEHGSQKKLLTAFNLQKTDFKKLKQRVEDGLRFNRFIDQCMANVPEPTEADIEQYYRAHLNEFAEPEQVRAAHIVKHVNDNDSRADAQEAIKQVKSRLDAGEAFAEVAKSESDCPSGGGDLGYFGRGQMVEAFEDVVFGMSIGAVSDIFETEFGFHIATLLDRRAASIRPLNDVRADIMAPLNEQLHHTTLAKFLAQERERATIEWDESSS